MRLSWLRGVKGKLYYWNHHVRSLVDIRFDGFVPRLLLHEKYEKKIKWTLRILTATGILMSFITIPPLYGFIVSLIMLGIEQFLEKSVFRFTGLFIQPLPNFKYDSNEWAAMYFAVPKVEALPFIVGIVFRTLSFATQIFNLLRAWNYNLDEDKENNICISFIIENDVDYSTYIYPNPDRRVVRDFHNKVAEKSKFIKYGKEYQGLTMQVTFCKSFSYGPDSHLIKFKNAYVEGAPILLKAYIFTENNEVKEIDSISTILKQKIKIKNRSDLTGKEVEYSHGKVVTVD